MNWTDLKNKIYYWDGSWRDIYVLQTNRDDWKKGNYIRVRPNRLLGKQPIKS